MIVIFISTALLVVVCRLPRHPCPRGVSEQSRDLLLRQTVRLLINLHSNAGEIESGGERPSIFTNIRAINYTADSLFEYQLNNNTIHNIEVTRQKNSPAAASKGYKCRGWDLLHKINAGNEINTPCQAAATM